MRVKIGFCCLVLLWSCSMTSVRQEKINGVSFVASGIPISEEHTTPVAKINANYAAIMPFGFIRDLNNPEIISNTERQWFGETIVGAKQYMAELRKKNIKIMLKPQIWVRHGQYTGHIEMDNEDDWKTLEASYSKFILDNAKLARDAKVEIFCIGTELEQFIANRPDFWLQLIREIKTIYKGKLTYAANWDAYKRTPFWDQLDYIGIDAYFPVSDSETPSVEECKKGWQKHKVEIQATSNLLNKPILFTEFGYRSVDFAGREPWQSSREMNQVNLEAQTNTTKALFEEFWNEPWFAGGFVWKWFHQHDEVGGPENSQFTPQNKPVEEVIKAYYSR